jgi:hypothetical protein
MMLCFVLPPLLGGKAGEIIVLTEAPGLVESARAVSALLMKLRLNPAVQEQALYWARNIAFLLHAALDEPLHTALELRSFDLAADHMRRAYAFLFTALG